MRLQNKVALITGASSGIGRETALLFAAEGAKIVVADVNDEGGNQTVELVQAQCGEAVGELGEIDVTLVVRGGRHAEDWTIGGGSAAMVMCDACPEPRRIGERILRHAIATPAASWSQRPPTILIFSRLCTWVIFSSCVLPSTAPSTLRWKSE